MRASMIIYASAKGGLVILDFAISKAGGTAAIIAAAIEDSAAVTSFAGGLIIIDFAVGQGWAACATTARIEDSSSTVNSHVFVYFAVAQCG